MRYKKHISIEVVRRDSSHVEFLIAEQTHRNDEFGTGVNEHGSGLFIDPETGFQILSSNIPEADELGNRCFLLGHNRDRDLRVLRGSIRWFEKLMHAVNAYNRHFGSSYDGKCHFTCGAVLCTECRKAVKDAIVFTFDGSAVGEGAREEEAEVSIPQTAPPPSPGEDYGRYYGINYEELERRMAEISGIEHIYQPPDPNVPEFIPDDDNEI